MYSALELSKYIVTKCINDGKPISNLQLQKILYYIQRDFLKQGEPAFSDTIVWSSGAECLLLLLWVWGYANFHFGKST